MAARQPRRTTADSSKKRRASRSLRGPGRKKRYACSKCGLQADCDEPDWLDPTLALWKPPKHLNSCIHVCPDDGGPGDDVLGCLERREYRLRSTFSFDDATIRACVPFAVLDRDDKRVRFGAALDYESTWRELSRRRFLEHQGPAERIDLQYLHDHTLETDPLRVRRTGEPVWVFPFRGRVQRLDQWGERVAHLQQRNTKARAMNRWKLARALDPRWSEGDDSRKHVVHVPIDLLSPIGGQLASHERPLGEAQRFLFGLADKPIPRRQTSTVWRNVYIYMLYESGDMTVPQIVDEVFPGQHVEETKKNVYRVLGRVRSAVANFTESRKSQSLE